MGRPRRTLRTQLTLLYAVPFLASGAILLSVPILSDQRERRRADARPARRRHAPGSRQSSGWSSPRPWPWPRWSLVVARRSGWLVAGRFLRPLRTITATARDISATNLHRRLGPTGRNDELTELADTLDDLFARLEASFESQRHFVANASHELRTPLTAERSAAAGRAGRPGGHCGQSARGLPRRCWPWAGAGAADRRRCSRWPAASGASSGGSRSTWPTIAGAVVRQRRAEAEQCRVGLVTDARPRHRRPAMPAWSRAWWRTWSTTRLRHNVAGGRVDLTTTAVDGRPGSP